MHVFIVKLFHCKQIVCIQSRVLKMHIINLYLLANSNYVATIVQVFACARSKIERVRLVALWLDSVQSFQLVAIKIKYSHKTATVEPEPEHLNINQ